VYQVLALLVLPKSLRDAKLGIMACGHSLQVQQSSTQAQQVVECCCWQQQPVVAHVSTVLQSVRIFTAAAPKPNKHANSQTSYTSA
jgi:hypothetical protein